MKVDHDEIFKCPQKTTGVFTRRFDENKCVFSAKCAGECYNYSNEYFSDHFSDITFVKNSFLFDI